ATPDSSVSGKFVKWNLPNPDGDFLLTVLYTMPDAGVNVWENLVLRPSFVLPGTCGTLSALAGTGGIEIMVTADESVTLTCNEGSLIDGWNSRSRYGEVTNGSATVTVRATEGNPLLGWVVTHGWSNNVGIPAPEVSLPVGIQVGNS